MPSLSPAERDLQARIAFMRFGLGPKPGWSNRIATSPRDACLEELTLNAHKISDDLVRVTGRNGVSYAMTAENIGMSAIVWLNRPFAPADCVNAEKSVRHQRYLEPEIGFVERLVLFWNNHFSVYNSHAAGHMERSVIRENVLGGFADMLCGVIKHPAMLAYLNNNTSCGPNSAFAQARARSVKDFSCTYNENLAREVLELHTLGLNGGYTQADVISLAKILTGWTIYGGSTPPTGQFLFNKEWHEPGSFRFMNNDYNQPGIEKGLSALKFLAAHQKTADHLAYKLLRHFITDTPSAAQVAVLSKAYRDNNGQLTPVYRALLDLPEAWSTPLNRFRQPLHWMIAANRALGNTSTDARRDAGRYTVFLTHLDQDLWGRLTPDGYPDDNYYWLNADAVRIRKNISGRLVVCSQVGNKRWSDPVAHAQDLFGTQLSLASRNAISGLSKEPSVAMILLLSTPELLRW